MLLLGKEIIRAAGYGTADLKQLMAQTEALADFCRIDPETDMGWKQPVVPEASVIGISQDPTLNLSNAAKQGSAGGSREFPAQLARKCARGWSMSWRSSVTLDSPHIS